MFSPPAQHFPRYLLRLRFPWLKGTPPSPGVAAPPGAQRWPRVLVQVPPESWISSGKIRDFDGKTMKNRMFSAIRSPASGFWLNLFQFGRFALSGDSTDHRAGADGDGELDALQPSCIQKFR